MVISLLKLKAVLSTWTTQSGSTSSTTALQQFQDSLGCTGKGGWDSLESLTILTPSMRRYGEPHSFHNKATKLAHLSSAEEQLSLAATSHLHINSC